MSASFLRSRQVLRRVRELSDAIQSGLPNEQLAVRRVRFDECFNRISDTAAVWPGIVRRHRFAYGGFSKVHNLHFGPALTAAGFSCF
jgi:hypothetical protein